jgi:hypothetical protein
MGAASGVVSPTASIVGYKLTRYAHDDQDIIFTGGGNGPYYGLRPLPKPNSRFTSLQAVLSHPVIEAMVRAIAALSGAVIVSHGKQFIKDLPIPPN